MDDRGPLLDNPDAPFPARRAFLARVGGLGAATLAGVVGPPMAGGARESAEAAGTEALADVRRHLKAYQVRQQSALRLLRRRPAAHPVNGDEDLYASRIGSYSKGLPHDDQCNVDPAAYGAFLAAMSSGLAADFEAIPLGGTVKLANPQSAYAFDLEGFDSNELGIPAPPAYASAQEASEMAEDYWMALTRDVPFADYETCPLVGDAADDLSAFSDFHGPKAGGMVTPGTLFRGDTPGDVNGPFLSQFLWKDIPYGPVTVAQKYRSSPAGSDYMTSFADCLARQRGIPPAPGVPLEATPQGRRPRRPRVGAPVRCRWCADFSSGRVRVLGS